MDTRKIITMIHHPPIKTGWQRRKKKFINWAMNRLYSRLPNVQLGANVRFSSFKNIGFVHAKSSLAIGHDTMFFTDMGLAVYESGCLTIGHSCQMVAGNIGCRYKITIGDRFLSARGLILEDTEAHPLDPSWREKQMDWFAEMRCPDKAHPTHRVLTPEDKKFFDQFPFAGMPPQVGKNVGEIVIGNNVWTGRNVTIRKGANIGDNCIIAANAVVTKPIPANCVAGGIPAKPLKEVAWEDWDKIRARVTSEWPDYRGDAQDSW